MVRKGLFQPFMLATLLSAGFLAVCYVASGWLTSVYGGDTLESAELLRFLPDGTPRVMSYPDGRRGGVRFRDLQGNPTPSPEAGVGKQLNCCDLPAKLPPQANDLAWDERVCSFADGRWPATYWYFVSDGRPNGAGYFVGYNSKSNALIGYLGMAGFREEPLPAEEWFPFDGPAWSTHCRLLSADRNGSPTNYPSPRRRSGTPKGSVSESDVYVFGHDGKIYHIDLQTRSVHVAMESSRLRSVAFSAGVPDGTKWISYWLTARTEDAVLVLDVQGRQLSRYPIPEALRNLPFSFAECNNGEAVLYWNSPDDSLAAETEYRIFWVKPDGQFRETAVALSHFAEKRPMQVYGGAAMPSPLGVGYTLVRERFQELLRIGLSATPAEALTRALREFWPALAIAQVIAFALAVLCYLRQVRYGASLTERVVWPLFVLLFGLPGWIGYRFGRSWPVLESCPECGVIVPRDRESCRCCTRDFPAPALKGTEVFA